MVILERDLSSSYIEWMLVGGIRRIKVRSSLVFFPSFFSSNLRTMVVPELPDEDQFILDEFSELMAGGLPDVSDMSWSWPSFSAPTEEEASLDGPDPARAASPKAVKKPDIPSTVDGNIAKMTSHKKKSSRKKPEDMPRRPLSSYNLFFRLERERILSGDVMVREITRQDIAIVAAVPQTKRPHCRVHGKIGFADLSRKVAERWKMLDPTTRFLLDEKAAQMKALYRKALTEWGKKKSEEASSYLPLPKLQYSKSLPATPMDRPFLPRASDQDFTKLYVQGPVPLLQQGPNGAAAMPVLGHPTHPSMTMQISYLRAQAEAPCQPITESPLNAMAMLEQECPAMKRLCMQQAMPLFQLPNDASQLRQDVKTPDVNRWL
jgi:hypothetical protein